MIIKEIGYNELIDKTREMGGRTFELRMIDQGGEDRGALVTITSSSGKREDHFVRIDETLSIADNSQLYKKLITDIGGVDNTIVAFELDGSKTKMKDFLPKEYQLKAGDAEIYALIKNGASIKIPRNVIKTQPDVRDSVISPDVAMEAIRSVSVMDFGLAEADPKITYKLTQDSNPANDKDELANINNVLRSADVKATILAKGDIIQNIENIKAEITAFSNAQEADYASLISTIESEPLKKHLNNFKSLLSGKIGNTPETEKEKLVNNADFSALYKLTIEMIQDTLDNKKKEELLTEFREYVASYLQLSSVSSVGGEPGITTDGGQHKSSYHISSMAKYIAELKRKEPGENFSHNR